MLSHLKSEQSKAMTLCYQVGQEKGDMSDGESYLVVEMSAQGNIRKAKKNDISENSKLEN